MRQFVVSSFAVLALCLVVNTPLKAQGVWTALATDNPLGVSGVSLLLSDGTVMVCGSNGLFADNEWTKLTPDAAGNYINGTWSFIAPMKTDRLFFASNVLPSGKVFVIGGEYSGANTTQNFTNLGEVYDPVANTWSAIATFPKKQFGDDPSVVLSNGKILCGYIGDGLIGGPTDGLTYLYDPVANSWTQTGTKLKNDQSDEETWALLPDGSVLSYNIFASPASGAGSAQRYIPATGSWVATGPVPVPLTNGINGGLPGGLGSELGPMMLLPDGRVFQIGANNSTVLYTPSTDTWAQGPSLPTNMGCDDSPAAMLPNGNVFFLADNSLPLEFSAPTRAYEFNPVTNSITDVTPGGALGAIMAENSAQSFCLLMLPNGHMLLTTGDGAFFSGGSTVWDFAPTGSPKSTWAPTIASVTAGAGSTYTLKGTQLNGISEGSSFGDDLENSTNYPIVRLKSITGVTKYARTTNWTPGLVATGSRQTTVNFTLPAGTTNGLYQLSVIANGIASPTQAFDIGPAANPSNVTAVFNSGTKTLTLTGDANANSLTVSLQAGHLTVLGANGTTINSTTEFTTAFTGTLALVANLNDGNDAMSVIGVSCSTANITLGAGNDSLAFTLSSITTLTADGGAGTDALLTTSTTIKTSHVTNFP